MKPFFKERAIEIFKDVSFFPEHKMKIVSPKNSSTNERGGNNPSKSGPVTLNFKMYDMDLVLFCIKSTGYNIYQYRLSNSFISIPFGRK